MVYYSWENQCWYICIELYSSTAGDRKVFGGPDNLELFEYTQHSDSIISWRSLGLHWDAFQMCLNNRGIELPLKMSAGNKREATYYPPIFCKQSSPFFWTEFTFRCHSFFSPLFILSFHCFHRCIFWSWSFRFSHTLPCHTGRPQKCRTEESVRGAQEFHMQRVNTATARKTHTHTHRSKHSTYPAALTYYTTPALLTLHLPVAVCPVK